MPRHYHTMEPPAHEPQKGPSVPWAACGAGVLAAAAFWAAAVPGRQLLWQPGPTTTGRPTAAVARPTPSLTSATHTLTKLTDVASSSLKDGPRAAPLQGWRTQPTPAASLVACGAAIGLALYGMRRGLRPQRRSASEDWVVCTTTGAAEAEDWPEPSTLAAAEAVPDSPPPPAAPTAPPAATPPTPNPSPAPAAAVPELKAKLYAKFAGTSRGFGTTSKDRDEIRQLLDALVATGAGDPEPTRGLYRANLYPGPVAVDGPTLGTWQLLYTTAPDVVVLEGNPFVQIQSIYQIIRGNGIISNVIDVGPRPTALLSRDTVLRQVVRIRGAARSATRVGLTFEAVSSKPVSIFGQDASSLPTLQLDLPFPLLSSAANLGADSTSPDGPGYLDVLYVDGDLLVYTQGPRGGVIALTKRPDLDGKLL